MRTSTLAAALALLLAGCDWKAEEQPTPQPTPDPIIALSPQQLDEQIMRRLRETGQFDWNQASAHFTWSALTRSDYVLSVGYRPAGFVGELPTDAATAPAWDEARAQVLALILAEERKARPDLTSKQLIAYPKNSLPVLDVTVRELSTVKALRASGLVRYAEPMGYEPNRATVAANSTLR